MVRIGMCDDDLDNINITSKMLESAIIEQNFDADITVITDSQDKILKEIKNKNIDVLFLDVDFRNSGKNGIDFASELRKLNKDFYLIFLSGHQRFMHVSFYVKVFDYLVKPVCKDGLNDVIKRLKEDISLSRNIFLNLNKWKSVRTDTIYYIERQNNKSVIITKYGSETTTKNLDALLKELPRSFAKCHRSYIANLDNIIKVDKKKGLAYFSKDDYCPINSHFNI